MTKAGPNFERLPSMSIDELADWLDKNCQFDTAPWTIWFNDAYCSKCEAVECQYAEAKSRLGITPYFPNDTLECTYCELEHRCRFFPDLEEIPTNLETIKIWLIEEVENERV